MVVSISLISIAVKCTLTSRRSCKKDLHMQQAVELLQAGISRAQQQLYGGNFAVQGQLTAWDAKEVLGGYHRAEVSYLLQPQEQGEAKLRCVVNLAASASVHDMIQISHEISISVPETLESNSTDNSTPGDDENEPSNN
jgi:hypothetical protein